MSGYSIDEVYQISRSIPASLWTGDNFRFETCIEELLEKYIENIDARLLHIETIPDQYFIYSADITYNNTNINGFVLRLLENSSYYLTTQSMTEATNNRRCNPDYIDYDVIYELSN